MTRSAAALAALMMAFGLSLAQDKPKDKDPKDVKETKDVKELDGTYKLVVAERDGKPAEKATLDVLTVTIKGDEFTLSSGPADKPDTKVAKIKPTPDAKLSTIDFTPQDGTEKGKVFPGIYKLDKGELTVVMSEKGERPKEFKSGDGLVLLRLKKVEK